MYRIYRYITNESQLPPWSRYRRMLLRKWLMSLFMFSVHKMVAQQHASKMQQRALTTSVCSFLTPMAWVNCTYSPPQLDAFQCLFLLQSNAQIHNLSIQCTINMASSRKLFSGCRQLFHQMFDWLQQNSKLFEAFILKNNSTTFWVL